MGELEWSQNLEEGSGTEIGEGVEGHGAQMKGRPQMESFEARIGEKSVWGGLQVAVNERDRIGQGAGGEWGWVGTGGTVRGVGKMGAWDMGDGGLPGLEFRSG